MDYVQFQKNKNILGPISDTCSGLNIIMLVVLELYL